MARRSSVKNIARALSDIEKEHEGIARLIKDIENAVQENNSDLLRRLLNRLQEIERKHYEHEERFMKQYDVIDYKIHKDQHDAMQVNLKELSEEYSIIDLRKPDSELARHFKNLLYHLVSIDEDMREFLEKLRSNIE